MIDAEPNGFFVSRDRPLDWTGFERAVEFTDDLRRTLTQATGCAARFTWLVRADPQIAEVYGSPAWGLAHYEGLLQTLSGFGDEVGLHVHAYHWNAAANRWIEDYGNQPWVAHCVEVGLRAFEETRGQRPAAFSMGVNWTNQATIDLVRRFGVRYDLSPMAGSEPQPLRFWTGTYTGTAPNCTRLPQQPYRPAPHDFAALAPEGAEDLWIFPLSSYIPAPDFSWKRRLYNRLGLRRAGQSARKLFLADRPTAMQRAIDAALGARPCPYLTFAIRTDEFCRRRSIAAIRRNLEYLVERGAGNLVFTTPPGALRILGCVSESTKGDKSNFAAQTTAA